MFDFEAAEDNYKCISALYMRRGTGYLEIDGSWKDIMYKELRRIYGKSNQEYRKDDTESSLFLRILIEDLRLPLKEAVLTLENIEKCYDFILSSLEEHGENVDKKNIAFLDIVQEYQNLSEQIPGLFSYRNRIRQKAKRKYDLLAAVPDKDEREYKLAAIVAEEESESKISFKMALMAGHIRLPERYQAIVDEKFEKLKAEYMEQILVDIANCFPNYVNYQKEDVPTDAFQNYVNAYIYSQLVPRDYKLQKIMELKETVGSKRYSVLYENEQYVLSWNDDKKTGQTKWLIKVKLAPLKSVDEELRFNEETYLLINEIKEYYGFFGHWTPDPDFAAFIDNAYSEYYFMPMISARNRLYGEDLNDQAVSYKASVNQMLCAIEKGRFVVLNNFKTVIGPRNGIRILFGNGKGQLLGFLLSPRESYALEDVVVKSLQADGSYNLLPRAIIETRYLTPESLERIFRNDTGYGTSRMILGNEFRYLFSSFWNTDMGKNEYIQTNEGAAALDSLIKMSTGHNIEIQILQNIDYKMFVESDGRKSLIRFEKVSGNGNIYNVHYIMDDGEYRNSTKYRNVEFVYGKFYVCENSMIDSPRYIDRDDEKVRAEELKAMRGQLKYYNMLMSLNFNAMSALVFSEIAYPLISTNTDIIDKVMDILDSGEDCADVSADFAHGSMEDFIRKHF